MSILFTPHRGKMTPQKTDSTQVYFSSELTEVTYNSMSEGLLTGPWLTVS